MLQLVCPRSLLMAVEDGSDSFVDLIPCQYTAVIQSHPGTTMAQYLFQYSFLSQTTFDPACILCLCVFFNALFYLLGDYMCTSVHLHLCMANCKVQNPCSPSTISLGGPRVFQIWKQTLIIRYFHFHYVGQRNV